MGTISDKLMRIISTKEDIRQALISKGYDVPTSIPFKEYAKMILDLPCKADSFPDIEGIVARYSASGLTNEQMAANPVWVDKTGNGHDLQLKNFSWKGMSGIGGYVADIDEWGTNSTAAYFERNSIKITATFKENASLGLLYHNIKLRQSCVLKVTGIPEGCDAFLDDRLGNRFYMSEDGVYEIIPSNFLAEALYLSIEKYPERWYGSKLTIEQLPLYPGALVFDGVDDYGTCDNFPILTKEKGYTVVVLRQWDQDFLNTTLTGGLLSTRNYSTGEGVAFEKIESSNKGYWNLGAGGIIDFAKSPFTWQTSKQYNNVGILKGDKNHGKPLCVGCGLSGGQQCGRFAIWELVFLDHDATEEELTKIKDYFVKTYPWLFPDQAWTVVGKTNEDEDRATIANITGNGNDLVLSNFAFSGNSGYGEYAYNFSDTSWISIPDYGVISDKTSKSFNIKSFVLADYPVLYTAVNKDSSIKKVKIKVTNSIPGFYFGNKPANQIIDLSTDGIYEIPSYNSPNDVTQYGFRCSNVNDSCNITIEQIPEYEGYLVTDGVDDKITSSAFEMGKDFTVVGEWRFIIDERKVAGLIKPPSFYLFNENNGLKLFINNTEKSSSLNTKSLKAICSDGRVYFDDWSEMLLSEEQPITSSSKDLSIGYNSTIYTQMAFKNLGIYNDQLLSKDECIKAYNYLQTIKSK
jgi:hypothetical protein